MRPTSIFKKEQDKHNNCSCKENIQPRLACESKRSETDGNGEKQPEVESPAPTAATPCPSSVDLGQLQHFNHSNLSPANQLNYKTYLGVVSQMNVGPGPDHSGHCMKERLRTVSNNCPDQVYLRGGRRRQPCTGNKCLDINRYGSSGDGKTRSMVNDGPTSFVDLHRTSYRDSLLEGTGINSCQVVCEQTYGCDRGPSTPDTFRITRTFQADSIQNERGESIHITTGRVDKTRVQQQGASNQGLIWGIIGGVAGAAALAGLGAYLLG